MAAGRHRQEAAGQDGLPGLRRVEVPVRQRAEGQRLPQQHAAGVHVLPDTRDGTGGPSLHSSSHKLKKNRKIRMTVPGSDFLHSQSRASVLPIAPIRTTFSRYAEGGRLFLGREYG